jgi:DNA-binding HxlR family transcriptional regulator
MRMKKTSARGLQLGAERVVGLFANKWTIKIIHELARADRRHGEIRRLLAPISQKVLTGTLRDLENSGLVQRDIAALKPLQVRYSLTPLGRSFLRPLNELCDWASEHETELTEISRRRRAYQKKPPREVAPGPQRFRAPGAGLVLPQA